MKTILKYLCLMSALIIFILSDLSFGFTSSKDIKWYTYKQGIELSKKEKKKMFLNFYADWCTYCRKMDKETFKDRSVISYLNDNFISIKINSDKETKIALDFGVKGLPNSWFIAEDGKKISSLPGYIPHKRLLNILQYIKTDSFKTMTFRKFMKTM